MKVIHVNLEYPNPYPILTLTSILTLTRMTLTPQSLPNDGPQHYLHALLPYHILTFNF